MTANAKSMILPAGALRHRSVVESYTEERTTMGSSRKVWSTVATRWVEIRPLSGKEPNTAQQASPRVTHKIVLRYLSGLDSTYRFRWGLRIFKVHSVLNLYEMGKLCVCIVEELPMEVAAYVFVVDDESPVNYLVDSDGAYLVQA